MPRNGRAREPTRVRSLSPKPRPPAVDAWVDAGSRILATSISRSSFARMRTLCPLLSPLAGVAVARSIRQVAGLYPAIKWPNDITIDGRKVAGILAESTMSAGKIEHAVVGIGINVALDVSRDPEIAATAASLDNLADSTVDRSELLRRILQHMDAIYLDLRRGRSPIPEWRRWLDTLGQRVVVSHHGVSNSGLAEDIDEHGNLLLRQDDGRLLTLTAGDITLRAEQGEPLAHA